MELEASWLCTRSAMWRHLERPARSQTQAVSLIQALPELYCMLGSIRGPFACA